MKENANIEQNEIINQFPGLYFWSEDGDDSTCLYSENITNLTGFTASEIEKLKNGWRSLIHEEDLHHFKKLLDEFEKSSDKEFLELEYRIIKKDESIVHLSEKIQVLRNDDGSILKRSGMILDVTNYKAEIVDLKATSFRQG